MTRVFKEENDRERASAVEPRVLGRTEEAEETTVSSPSEATGGSPR